jgi:hypothetical protein
MKFEYLMAVIFSMSIIVLVLSMLNISETTDNFGTPSTKSTNASISREASEYLIRKQLN